MAIKAKQKHPPYLFLRGHVYWVKVKTPRTLEEYFGPDKRATLNTRDVREAERRKHAYVAKFKADFVDARRRLDEGLPVVTALYADTVTEVRNALAAATKRGDTEEQEVLAGYISDHARNLEDKYGEPAALKWYNAATNINGTMMELASKWLDSSDYAPGTRAGYLGVIRTFSKHHGEDEPIASVTHAVAVDYIDNHLSKRGLAYKTIRFKVEALSLLWQWLASKAIVPRNDNPWTGHKVSKKANPGRSPSKVGYTDEEIILLLKGTEKAHGWPTAKYLADLAVLGLYSGARIEELCSLTARDVRSDGRAVILQIEDAKTKAGNRPVALVNKAACAVAKRRFEAATKVGLEAPLFPELKPGGPDNRLSYSASKAFTRYRRECKVADGKDFHSFRRTVVTVLERAQVRKEHLDRFIGHKTMNLALDVYSDGTDERRSIETAQQIRYSPEIEAAALARVSEKTVTRSAR